MAQADANRRGDDVGGPPDAARVTFAVDCMKHGKVDDLLNAATRERLQQAGNVTGEVPN